MNDRFIAGLLTIFLVAVAAFMFGVKVTEIIAEQNARLSSEWVTP